MKSDKRQSLSNNEKKLILITALRVFASAFGGYFVAKWTINFDNGLQRLILQAAIGTVPHLIFYWLGVKLSKKIRLSNILGAASFLQIISYTSFLVLILINKSGIANIAIGFISGCSGGLHWSCYNDICQNCTEGKTRIKFLAVDSSVSSIFSMIAPATMGLIVLAFGNHTIHQNIYFIFFAVTVIFFFLSMILAYSLKLGTSANKSRVKIKMFSKNDKHWNTILTYGIFYGILTGATGSIGSVFLVSFSNKPAIWYLFILAAAIFLKTILGSLFSKIHEKINRLAAYIFFSIIEAACFILVIIFYNTDIAIIIGIICLILRESSTLLRVQMDLLVQMDAMSVYIEENLSGRYLAREIIIILSRMLISFAFVELGIYLTEKTALFVGAMVSFVIANTILIWLFNRLNNINQKNRKLKKNFNNT